MAGSPVILEAFRRLCTDQRFKAGMDLQVALALVAKENAKIEAYENEMLTLSSAMSSALASISLSSTERRSSHARMSYLMDLVRESQTKCTKLNDTRRTCEKAIVQQSA